MRNSTTYQKDNSPEAALIPNKKPNFFALYRNRYSVECGVTLASNGTTTAALECKKQEAGLNLEISDCENVIIDGEKDYDSQVRFLTIDCDVKVLAVKNMQGLKALLLPKNSNLDDITVIDCPELEDIHYQCDSDASLPIDAADRGFVFRRFKAIDCDKLALELSLNEKVESIVIHQSNGIRINEESEEAKASIARLGPENYRFVPFLKSLEKSEIATRFAQLAGLNRESYLTPEKNEQIKEWLLSSNKPTFHQSSPLADLQSQKRNILTNFISSFLGKNSTSLPSPNVRRANCLSGICSYLKKENSDLSSGRSGS